MKHIFVICALVLCVFGGSRPAEAQIYSWKDANGILVVSNVAGWGAQPAATSRALTARVGGAPVLMSIHPTFEPLIREHSLLQGVRADLVRAVIQVESAFNPRAVSPKGAMGLMQLMPATAARFGVLDAFNPAENIRAGVGYLKQLLLRYENNEQLALAAYNAGPLAVDRHGSQIPPYKETQDYVRRISALGGAANKVPGTNLYKSIEIIDGKPVIVISDRRPATGTYQQVSR